MEVQTDSAREKFETVNRLLEGEYILVHLSTAADDLLIPDHLKSTPVVTLKLSHWFRGGMEVKETLITANLLFNGKYFSCEIPLAAVWGVTGAKGENLVWPVSMPPEIMRPATALASVAEARSDIKAVAVSTATTASAPVTEASPAAEVDKPGQSLKARGHLRRIK